MAHCTDTTCTSATTVTLDSVGDVGYYTSIAIGADGLGLISYYDNTNHELKVAHCVNAACSSATTATLDSAGEVAQPETQASADTSTPHTCIAGLKAIPKEWINQR